MHFTVYLGIWQAKKKLKVWSLWRLGGGNKHKNIIFSIHRLLDCLCTKKNDQVSYALQYNQKKSNSNLAKTKIKKSNFDISTYSPKHSFVFTNSLSHHNSCALVIDLISWERMCQHIQTPQQRMLYIEGRGRRNNGSFRNKNHTNHSRTETSPVSALAH